MSDKDFKVKNKLVVNGLTGGAGPLVANSNKEIDSVAFLTTLQGGTGTTTSPSAGQVLYSAGGTTYNPTTLNTLDVKGATYSADAPSSPVIGQIWVESDTSSDSFDPNIIRRKTFTATANQTVFTTDVEFIQGYEQVFFNGMLLIRNSDYTTASNTNVTLAAGAAAGDIIEVVSITNLNSINTATTTTNTFTGSQYITGGSSKLGIGSSSPSKKLVISDQVDNTYASLIRLANTGSGSNGTAIEFAGTYNASGLDFAYNAGRIGGLVTNGITGNGNLIFEVNSSGTLTERLRLTESGNISTGRLTVIGSVGDGDYIIRALPPAGSSGQRSNVAFYATFSNFPQDTGPRRVADIIGGFSTGTWGTEYLSFNVGSSTDTQNVTSEKMRIDNSGNVGIGNSSPGGRLQITVPSTERLPVLGTAYGSLRLLGSTNAWGMYMGIKDDTGAGSLQVMRGDSATAYDFFLQPVGGNVAIGYSSSQGSYKLQVNSQIFATSSSIATSDGRFKENVDTISGGLGIIDSLRPVSFTWKDHPVHNFVTGKTVGFIAQEVQEALSEYDWVDNIIKSNMSEAVLDEEGNEVTPAEEFLGIAESNIIPLLVAAVKELKARVETLEAK